jgi:hypothetical protein
MSSEPLFTGNDLSLIESLVYNPTLEPKFDGMRDCLFWADEEPDGLTSDGYDTLIDLWAARSFLHKGRDFSTYKLSPDYFRLIWERALAQGFRWPGFNRLTLSDADRIFYDKHLKEQDWA